MIGGEARDDAAPRSPAAAGADPSAVVSLLRAVEMLPSVSTGALIFGPGAKPQGSILLENGRVCWAGAAAMGSRLVEILRGRLDPGVSPSALDETIKKCRAESTPLGEALVAAGLFSSAGLRDAFRQHTAEAIVALAGLGGEPPAWVARKQRFAAQFTFGPVEILASMGAALAPGLAGAARGEMEPMLRHGGYGVAFAKGLGGAGGLLLPVGEVNGSKLTLGEAVELGAWGARAVRENAAVSGVPRLVAAMGAKGDALVAWLTGAVIYVVICPSPSSLAHVLGKRARAPSDDRSGS